MDKTTSELILQTGSDHAKLKASFPLLKETFLDSIIEKETELCNFSQTINAKYHILKHEKLFKLSDPIQCVGQWSLTSV